MPQKSNNAIASPTRPAFRLMGDSSAASRIRYAGFAAALAIMIAMVAAAPPPSIEATLPLNQLFPGGVGDTALVFLDEDTLASLSWPSVYSDTTHISVLRLKDRRLRVSAQKDVPHEGHLLYSVSNARILLVGAENSVIYSEDLLRSWELPISRVGKLFPLTGIVGDFRSRGEVFRLTEPPTPLPRRGGELLASSDSLLVYRTADTIQTVTPEGIAYGSISAPDVFGNVDVAGKQRLYIFNESNTERITDLAGKTICRVQTPKGNGFRHGWSSDGSRLLFDHYFRNVLPGQRLTEKIIEWLFGVSGPANAELVRVIDVSTGAICFDIERPDVSPGIGSYHADLSPSGRLVAIASRTELTVYRLPTACAGR